MRIIVETKEKIYQLAIGEQRVIITPIMLEVVKIDGKVLLVNNLPVQELLPQPKEAISIPLAKTRLWSGYSWNAALLNHVDELYRHHRHRQQLQSHWQPPRGYVGNTPGKKRETANV
jgi:hypothetical protein